ncbi:hypothetical protein A3L11_10760 [Thermococcus siculi]|uniref:Transcription regulator AsnC/Lrp ligand binding domain-containing protein n=1 Tax=Thermococcus siculi TaxID=72803 RepID=A0A2Z2MPB0_9EURY|nr:hypothetical protein [Thermococcus siculi]ASJ09688.1 hypothetical protein A3L11_10760 [Thermococcus siculi]
MRKIEAILLVWGVRDEVLEKLPVEGYWLYGEYDFIAKVDFRDEFEMEEFSKLLRKVINGGTFKLMPVTLSAVKEGEGAESAAVLEHIKVSAP